VTPEISPFGLRLLTVLERLLLTAWVGALWATGYLAVPVLFGSLERMEAGRLAGTLFTTVSWLGLGCGLFLLACALWRDGWRSWRVWLLGAMLGIVAVGEFALQPQMAALKLTGLPPGSEAATRFAALHGVSSSLYLLLSLGGAVLVAVGIKGAGGGASPPAGR